MSRKLWIGPLVLMLLLLNVQCKNKAEIQGISLEVTFADEELSDKLMTEMQLRWKTDGQFQKLSQDFHVFVHFWHNDNLLFQADYVPEVPTTAWEPDQEYIDTRKIYIPEFIDEFDPDFKGEETLKLSVGFFSPYDRSGESKQLVLEEKLKVVPPPLDTPEIIYESGWHDLEQDPEAYLQQWRWTEQEAHCIIDNPHRDALLVIRGGVNRNALEGQKVIFKINDLILDEFTAEESTFEKTYNIKKEMLGEKDEFVLTLATDKIFVPSELFQDSSDERILGMQISFIYFR
jgi:hypothetical protein